MAGFAAALDEDMSLVSISIAIPLDGPAEDEP